MKPVDIQPIGGELAVKWEDGREDFSRLETLRRECPCAGCKGEMDVMGNLYKNPERPLAPNGIHLVRLQMVGAYGIQPVWGDGHSTGIYSYDYLRALGSGDRE